MILVHLKATKAVGAHDFIMRLPDGYDTTISEGSSNIPLCQRQLISFARALLIDTRILILDEATSSVDPYTELIIQNALQKLLENRTAIIIVHRLSTVRSANKIVILNNGEVVEEGTHKELLTKNGLYSLLYRSQLRDDVKVQVLVVVVAHYSLKFSTFISSLQLDWEKCTSSS